MLIDEIKLHIKAGKGGDGVVRWRREKFIPKGGPWGGNGGDGGSVYAVAVNDISRLLKYRYIKSIKAEDGKSGKSRNQEGKSGSDYILELPVGSVITDEFTGEKWDLDKVGKKVLLAKGGKGGLGNTHFKSSTNTTPYEWTPGQPGEERTIKIELKLIADIGLVGLPNAGKSTFINMVTNSKSKIGEYAFTTLEPHLGVTKSGLIIADIPGLIAGASKGKGLGYKFLKHIERTRVVVHLVSVENESVAKAYNIVREELKSYGRNIENKPEIVLLTKIDTIDESELKSKINEIKDLGINPVPVSAYIDETIKDAMSKIELLANK